MARESEYRCGRSSSFDIRAYLYTKSCRNLKMAIILLAAYFSRKTGSNHEKIHGYSTVLLFMRLSLIYWYSWITIFNILDFLHLVWATYGFPLKGSLSKISHTNIDVAKLLHKLPYNIRNVNRKLRYSLSFAWFEQFSTYAV